jgi:hypothetical protein
MEPNHIHHRYYSEELKSFDERLMVSILGRPESDIVFPNITQRFQPYLGWIEQPQVLALRFEEFLLDQTAVVGRALAHAADHGFPIARSREQAVQLTLQQLDPQRSPTFRSGKAGGWRDVFTPQHKQVFKEVAGELLVQLGYEKDLNW